ncbi:MAG: DNA-directed RNA polymerase subunit omega [Lachnospiraceae bacterium]|nr:DNA-directed RNA polymerase subunit omega [Lachnospiraceae bacterium]
MLHPSYSDLMKVVNSEVEEGETPVVNSRYSIVMATSKRARQIIARQSGAGEDMREFSVSKPLSKAVEELYSGQLKIKPGEQEDPEEEKAKAEIPEMAETAEASATAETETEETEG